MMTTIATSSLAERTTTDTYLFFSLVASGFIFPIGLAWCWNDGWLQNLGFVDHGGASIVHIMGGLAGFMGTYLLGPRAGLFSKQNCLSFILEMNFEEDSELQRPIEMEKADRKESDSIRNPEEEGELSSSDDNEDIRDAKSE